MFANNLMTPSMLAKELNIGSSTVRFLLNRFNKWLPYIEKDGEKLYQSESLHTLKFISEKINSGMLPTEIDNALDDKAKREQSQVISPSLNSFIPSLQSVIQDAPSSSSSMNQLLQVNDSIQLISALFEKFYNQQERIVAAQERKASAEERKAEAEKIKAEAEQQKAYALAKRADAEQHKANAINNLADAIKNISTDFLKSLPIGTLFSSPQFQHQYTNQFTPQPTPEKINENDYLSALIEDEDDKIDDLSALIEDEGDYEDDKIDDLSALIKDEGDYEDDKIDDLSALIEDEGDYEDDKIDDLSALIEDEGDYEDDKIDDLSALIEDEQNGTTPEILDSDVDDLMSLIDEDTESLSNTEFLDDNAKNRDIMDDLSALINEDVSNLKPVVLDSDVDDLLSLIADDKQDDIMNDLSALLEAEKKEPLPPTIEKPKASLEKNFEQYKSEVINIIIKLRKDGHTVEQTTELLNNEEIKTLSGKSKWTTKMIAKIYTFIETAER